MNTRSLSLSLSARAEGALMNTRALSLCSRLSLSLKRQADDGIGSLPTGTVLKTLAGVGGSRRAGGRRAGALIFESQEAHRPKMREATRFAQLSACFICCITTKTCRLDF